MASRATAYRSIATVARREDAQADVQVLRFGGIGIAADAVDARLVEISIYGCRVACAIESVIDEPVRLSLNGSLPIAARIVWSRGGMIGCRFEQSIGRALMRSLTMGN